MKASNQSHRALLALAALVMDSSRQEEKLVTSERTATKAAFQINAKIAIVTVKTIALSVRFAMLLVSAWMILLAINTTL